MKIFFKSILLFSVIFAFGCAKTDGVAPGSTLPSTTPSLPSIPSTDGGSSYFALAYGNSSTDRDFLNSRIAGYAAPGMSDIVNNWRRIAGTSIFNSAAEIAHTPIECFSTLDPLTGRWANTMISGSSVYPGTAGICVNSNNFISASWSVLSSPNRLFNAANGSYFNGFISPLKFNTYTNQTVVSSTDLDDDGIGLIVAAVVDSTNHIHTLTALRTQGGFAPTLGWALVYRKDNTIISTFGDKSVGGVNTNGSQGDRNGWNGRKALVRVERTGDIVDVYTSQWATGSNPLVIDSASKIEVDLSAAANNLSIFQGEQYYGYGTISQVGATFSDMSFTVPNAETDPTYIYDLENDLVYLKQASGGYAIVAGVSARSTIGYSKRVKNTETQKEFLINADGSYVEL